MGSMMAAVSWSPGHSTERWPARLGRGASALLLSLLSLAVAQPLLTLERALELSLQSPAMVLAGLGLAGSERQFALASGLVSGEVSAGYSASSGQLTAPSLAEPQSLDSAGFDPIRLNLSFNVVPYGPRYDAILQAEARVTQAELDLRDTRSEAVVTVVSQYLDALRAAQEVEVVRFAAEVARTELEATEARFETGAASSPQLTQAQISLQQADNTVASAELAALQALRTLSTTLGVQVEAVAEVELSEMLFSETMLSATPPSDPSLSEP